MRDRRQAGWNVDAQESHHAAPVARIFTPSDLDIDRLAEAIRQLLGPAPGPPVPEDAPNQPNGNLLSFPRGVTHVVEANEAP